MRRLTPRRDEELRHIVRQNIAWRWSDTRREWYPYCRCCYRDASKQVNWLIGAGYVAPAGEMVSVNVQPADLAGPYLERYPR